MAKPEFCDRSFVNASTCPPAKQVHKEELEDDESNANATLQAKRQIIKSGAKINHLEKTGEPVLFLPEENNE